MDWLNLRKKTLFLLFVVIILLFRTDAQDHVPKCLFKVQRGTVYKAFINKPLTISCNLKDCDGQTVNVIWTKEIMKKWNPVSGADLMTSSQKNPSSDLLTSYLTFTNISEHHVGIYRCELKLSNVSGFSHHINVSVSDERMEEKKCCTEKPEIDSIGSSPWWRLYLYISSGFVVLFLIVMLVSILCIYASKSSRRKNTERSQVQSAATPMLSSASPNVKCDEFVCVQYSTETQQHSHGRNTHSLTLPHVHISDCGGHNSLSNRRDSGSSQVVYASLHHLTATLSSTKPPQTREDSSEYAAIRVS